MATANRNKKEKTIDKLQVTQNRPLKWFYVSLGTLAVALGFFGIFLPLLPTTGFLLLAAWAYARSSQRFYNWLLNNRVFGRYITAYLEGKGMPVVSKVSTLMLLWLSILTSVILFVENIYVIVILGIVAIGVTIHILTLPTYRKEKETSKETKVEQTFSEKLPSP